MTFSDLNDFMRSQSTIGHNFATKLQSYIVKSLQKENNYQPITNKRAITNTKFDVKTEHYYIRFTIQYKNGIKKFFNRFKYTTEPKR